MVVAPDVTVLAVVTSGAPLSSADQGTVRQLEQALAKGGRRYWAGRPSSDCRCSNKRGPKVKQRIYTCVAAMLARLAESLDRRWPGGGTDDGDDTDQFLRKA